jgi:hypothetical protein
LLLLLVVVGLLLVGLFLVVLLLLVHASQSETFGNKMRVGNAKQEE